MSDVIEILRNLVSFNTYKDAENDGIMDYCSKFLKERGFNVETVTNDQTGKSILMATMGKNPKIAFVGHTDTVVAGDGWDTDPLQLTEKDGKLFGLGACDMKGGIAAFFAAIDEIYSEKGLLNEDGGIAVYLSYDEEILFNGIKDLVKLGMLDTELTIVGEPTDLRPTLGSKGLLEYKFTFRGTAGHSAAPVEGENSNKNAVAFLSKMLELEEELKQWEYPGFDVSHTTMNIGIINGGTAVNKIPDETSVYMDFRIVDSEKQYQFIRDRVDKAMEGLKASYEIINDVPSFLPDKEAGEVYEKIIGKSPAYLSGITEASFISGNRLILGPGPSDTMHKKNEFVSIRTLSESVRLYKLFILMLNEGGKHGQRSEN